MWQNGPHAESPSTPDVRWLLWGRAPRRLLWAEPEAFFFSFHETSFLLKGMMNKPRTLTFGCGIDIFFKITEANLRLQGKQLEECAANPEIWTLKEKMIIWNACVYRGTNSSPALPGFSDGTSGAADGTFGSGWWQTARFGRSAFLGKSKFSKQPVSDVTCGGHWV